MTEQYVFTPNTDQGFVPLSRTKSGRLVRKEILRTGDLNYPGVKGGKVNIDTAFLSKVVENFDSKVCDIVQFPLADGNNAHTEDPLRNGGEVVKLQQEGNSLYAYIDVRKDDVVKGITDKTIIGASAMLALDYTDTRSGTKAGPTLLHVAATNRPHVLELEDFEVIAASVDSKGEAVLLTSSQDLKETHMPTNKDELIASLLSEHDIDVNALLATSEANTSIAELSAKLTEALDGTGIIKLSNGETAKAEDLVLAVGQLVEEKTELSGRVDALEAADKRKTAEARVDKAIEEGFISESTREAHLEIALSSVETFEKLLPEQPIIKLTGEASAFAPADEKPSDVVTAEIDRYTALAAQS